MRESLIKYIFQGSIIHSFKIYFIKPMVNFHSHNLPHLITASLLTDEETEAQ